MFFLFQRKKNESKKKSYEQKNLVFDQRVVKSGVKKNENTNFDLLLSFGSFLCNKF